MFKNICYIMMGKQYNSCLMRVYNYTLRTHCERGVIYRGRKFDRDIHSILVFTVMHYLLNQFTIMP